MRTILLAGVSAVAVCAFGIGVARAQVQDANDLSSVETVTVTAPGETRHVESVSDVTMQEAGAGVSPIKVLGELPSVNFTTADAYGAYEWATRISVRGFNQNQLGFTLDDVPLGDMSYGNWNGLHISRAIIDENIAKATISQGTGSLGTASNSNLGGTVQFYSLDPSDKPNARVDQSFGSDNAYRTYVRLDTGLLSSGTKASLSAAYQDSDKWKGYGNISQKYYQINGKVVQSVGDEGTLTGFLNYSDRREIDYQDLSRAYVNKLGYNWDNYGDWTKAVQAATAVYGIGNYPAGTNTLSASDDQIDAAYYGGSGLRKDTIGGVTYQAPINDALSMKSTVYAHRDDGRGLWFAPVAETFVYSGLGQTTVNGSPVLLRTTEYGLTRYGNVSSLTYTLGQHTIEGGVWTEREYFDLARRYYATTSSSPIYALDEFPDSPFATQWAYHFTTSVLQVYVQDTWKVTDRLTLTAGAKDANTWINGQLAQSWNDPSNYAQGTLYAGAPFLPQVGLNYKVGGKDEIFADVAKNLHTFEAGGNGFANSPWGTTQANFDALKQTIKPETSWTEEIGYRFNHGPVTAELSAFHTNFSNRLLASSTCGICGTANVLANVGGVTSNGVDLAINTKLPHGFSWYNGGTWNRATYDKGILVSGTYYDTKGKITVDTPEWLYKTDFGWHSSSGFFAHIGGDYMGKRYYTYNNDNGVPDYFIANAGIGYLMDQLGPLHDVRLQLNIFNLFDKKYISTIGTNGFTASDPTGTFQTLQAGSPATVVGSISAQW
jgi:iron complex outermembrane recepter protein